jgi:hypothetical protein
MSLEENRNDNVIIQENQKVLALQQKLMTNSIIDLRQDVERWSFNIETAQRNMTNEILISKEMANEEAAVGKKLLKEMVDINDKTDKCAVDIEQMKSQNMIIKEDLDSRSYEIKQKLENVEGGISMMCSILRSKYRALIKFTI